MSTHPNHVTAPAVDPALVSAIAIAAAASLTQMRIKTDALRARVDEVVAILQRQRHEITGLEAENFGLRAALKKAERRLHWLHDCSTGTADPDGYEWGLYRVKWVNGQAAEVWATLSDFSDLDAEMEREAQARTALAHCQPALSQGGDA
jgi:hypothetical protein